MGEISINPKFNIHETYKKVRILNPYRDVEEDYYNIKLEPDSSGFTASYDPETFRYQGLTSSGNYNSFSPINTMPYGSTNRMILTWESNLELNGLNTDTTRFFIESYSKVGDLVTVQGYYKGSDQRIYAHGGSYWWITRLHVEYL